MYIHTFTNRCWKTGLWIAIGLIFSIHAFFFSWCDFINWVDTQIVTMVLMYALYEHASGYALFLVKEFEEVRNRITSDNTFIRAYCSRAYCSRTCTNLSFTRWACWSPKWLPEWKKSESSKVSSNWRHFHRSRAASTPWRTSMPFPKASFTKI